MDRVDEALTRFWTDLVGRLTGPLTLRLFLQPAIAGFFAVRDGIQDAKAGRPPYFWTLFTQPEKRRELIGQGWKAVFKVFIAAVTLDVAYQLIALRTVYPLETLVVAFLLACFPYLLFRGPANWIARSWW